MGNEKMPQSLKVHRVLSVATGGCAEKCQGCPIAIASHHGRKGDALNSQGSSYVLRLTPSGSMVAGDSHHRMTIAIVPCEIYGVVGAYSHGRIAVGWRTARYGMYGPGQPVVHRDNDGLGPATVFVGNISCAIGTDLDVAMQAGTRRQSIDGYRRTVA